MQPGTIGHSITCLRVWEGRRERVGRACAAEAALSGMVSSFTGLETFLSVKGDILVSFNLLIFFNFLQYPAISFYCKGERGGRWFYFYRHTLGSAQWKVLWELGRGTR